MKTNSNLLFKVLVAAILVIVPLVGAAWWIPANFPLLPRQLLLTMWGVGATLVAERLCFAATWASAGVALGFVAPRWRATVVALLVSVPMWLFLPLYARLSGVAVTLQFNWLAILLGVILVNGITEEVIHRAFVFGNLRRQHSFLGAAAISAGVFAAQHLYLIFSMGWAAGLASVLLAALLAFPLAYLFEKGGNSIAACAILHTSSNAPVMLFALPPALVSAALIPHMGVVLVSIYLAFAFRNYLNGDGQASAQGMVKAA